MSSRESTGFGPVAALAALTGIWGYNWVVIKVALADASPLTFAALRSLLSAVLLFAVLLLTGRALAPVRGRSMIVLGLLQTTGFVGLVALALESGAAGKSAVLAYTMPFWTLLLAGPLLGERVRGLQWVAVALAGIGLVGIVSPWDEALGIGDSLLSLAAAWCWAASNIVVKRMALDGNELLNVSAWQMSVGALVLGALALVAGDESVRWTPSFSIALAYNVVLATALAWLLWVFALSRLSAGAAGLASLGAPVFALGAAWVQLGERPTLTEGAGMLLTLAALAVLSLTGWRQSARAAPEPPGPGA
jgi:drug/metabolite transporter (DMT)-like permease